MKRNDNCLVAFVLFPPFHFPVCPRICAFAKRGPVHNAWLAPICGMAMCSYVPLGEFPAACMHVHASFPSSSCWLSTEGRFVCLHEELKLGLTFDLIIAQFSISFLVHCTLHTAGIWSGALLRKLLGNSTVLNWSACSSYVLARSSLLLGSPWNAPMVRSSPRFA